jgi:hypothetical protein
MSTITTDPSRDSHHEMNDRHEIATNPATAPRHSDQLVGRCTSRAPDQRDRVAVYQLIAQVLRRAHRTAEDLGEPNEARAIFHVAASFADELTTTNPEFDRLRFIKAATGLP